MESYTRPSIIVLVLVLTLSLLVLEIVHNLNFMDSVRHSPCSISAGRAIHILGIILALILIIPVKVILLLIKVLLHLLILVAVLTTATTLLVVIVLLLLFITFVLSRNKIECHTIEHWSFLIFPLLFLLAILELLGDFSEIRDINRSHWTRLYLGRRSIRFDNYALFLLDFNVGLHSFVRGFVIAIVGHHAVKLHLDIFFQLLLYFPKITPKKSKLFLGFGVWGLGFGVWGL